MRKLFLLIFLAAVLSTAQTIGPQSITSTQCTPGVSTESMATVGFQVTGSWSGTIQPKGYIDGQPAFNLSVTPSASSVAQSTVIANGAYFVGVSGFSGFQLCGATVTNTAKIYFNVRKASR